MSNVVFHFTGSANLPAIMRDSYLWPTQYDYQELLCFRGEWLVWATACSHGDEVADEWARTTRRKRLNLGKVARITLPRRGFISWTTLKRRRLQEAREREAEGYDVDPEDTADIFEQYEGVAKIFGEPNVMGWHVHPGPVPIRRARKIEILTNGRWRAVPPPKTLTPAAH